MTLAGTSMLDELSQLLSREQWTLELLARETHTPIARVQAAFLSEYNRLSANARVKSFLPLLALNSVRVLLDAENARQGP
jgi:hypothetical protein